MIAKTQELDVRRDGVFRGDVWIPFPPNVLRKNTMNQTIIGNKKLYMNGYELMEDNTFKRTFKAIFYMLF